MANGMNILKDVTNPGKLVEKFKHGKKIAWLIVLLPFFFMGLMLIGLICAVSFITLQTEKTKSLKRELNIERQKQMPNEKPPEKPSFGSKNGIEYMTIHSDEGFEDKLEQYQNNYSALLADSLYCIGGCVQTRDRIYKLRVKTVMDSIAITELIGLDYPWVKIRAKDHVSIIPHQ